MSAETNKTHIDRIAKELLSKKATQFNSNSLKVVVYIISKAGEISSLFIIGDNSYQLCQEVGAITNKSCTYEDVYYDNKIYPKELNKSSIKEKRRLEKLVRSGGRGLVFCDALPKELHIHVKNKDDLKKEIKLGDKINKEEFITMVAKMGYSRVDTTRYHGDISSRGGIVDVFSIKDNNPTRIDFFGDNIDSIRRFNPTSQISIKELNSASIKVISEDIKPLKSITYKDFLNKYNYKIIYLSIKENDYILSNSLGVGVENTHTINTKKIIKNEEEINLKKVEIIQVGEFGEIQNNDNTLDKKRDKNSEYEYEAISNNLMLKYKNELKKVFTTEKRDNLVNVHNYSWGDFITHEDFGVGLFRGIITKNKNDYIKVEYKNNSSVLVSIHKVHKICPYIGVPRPELNNINNKSWSTKTEKTKVSVKKIIEEMILVNKNRDLTRINNIKSDKLIEGEVEKSFAYIETPDQIAAIKEIYEDMGTPGLMDRIIIGDVGFGKTEVALRAAVRCVVSGGFVLIVVPTTILADQHYISFRGRLENTGINVKMISRFVSDNNKKQICKSIVDKHTDILVGTHAVLSDDIPKNRLSLIIVDEEHKFGVKHKNKLLKMRRAIDVLTLSATPIPRTLQQSLLGIRDVSLIQTPPINRLPIKTRVLYRNWDHINSLIKHEFLRDGQVYFLHNRVETLPVVFKRLQLMFPTVNIAMAHGKMPSNKLEPIVLSFFSGRIKMLVCTSIIESGLDVSNANTIIINDAHRFGLSQLYQMRGRVGRSTRQAYCYLTIPDIKTLSGEAIQRLRAIESSVDLGSGYNIALKDLEIRGSGNLFGYEQSGSVDKVGYHLYCKMFERALQKSKSEDVFPSLQINPFFSSSFNAEYMPLSEDRMYYYQRIASTFHLNELASLKLEVVDRFGRLSDDAKNIFILAKLRILYTKSLVSKIDINKNSVIFTFQKNDGVSINSYLDAVFLKLANASVDHVFKQLADDRLLVDIVVDKNIDPVSVAFNCIEYFIYNKKNS